MMEDLIELSVENCPKCGNQMVWQRCQVPGCDDGYINMHDYDDPLWYDDGEYEPCNECRGFGSVTWCQKCGHCVNDHQPMPNSFSIYDGEGE